MRVVLFPNHSYTATFGNQLKHCITEISYNNGNSKCNPCMTMAASLAMSIATRTIAIAALTIVITIMAIGADSPGC